MAGPFKLRSGNGPLKFKNMGSSPARDHEKDWSGTRTIQHETSETPETPKSETPNYMDNITIDEGPKYAEGAVPEHPSSWEAYQNHLYNIDQMEKSGSSSDEAYETFKEVHKDEIQMHKDLLYQEDLKKRDLSAPKK